MSRHFTLTANAMFRLLAGSLGTSLLLVACGGGGGSGDGGNKAPPSDDIPSAKLAAPTNLTAELDSLTDGRELVVLTWTESPEASNHIICYAQESIADVDNCSSYKGGTLVLNATSPHVLMSLDKGKQYYLRVVGVDSDNRSGLGSEEALLLLPTGGLNDTGIDWCADESTNYTGTEAIAVQADCDSVAGSHPGQDGMTGRDALARSDTLNGTSLLEKVGAGSAGFDFTKVCHSGEIAGYGDCPADPGLGVEQDNWGCTRDNVTGFTWEIKTTDGGKRDADKTYASIELAETYSEDVNTQGLCGASDWRVPTLDELNTILHFGREAPLTDTTFFPNTKKGFYMSSTLGSYSDTWSVNFTTGKEFITSSSPYVRLVRDN